MKKERIKRNIKNSALRDNEDIPVIDHIDSLDLNRKYTMLEVGSGECRFVDKVQHLYPNISITCIEVNPSLADIAKCHGFEIINQNVLDVKLDRKYDIVHCSHVIEHFGYPDITKVLEFLVDAVAEGGRLIIRSPLLRDEFYYDIDHIRPYPPQAIDAYFHCNQQQKKGTADIAIERVWYRTEAKQLARLNRQHMIWGIPFARKPMNRIIDMVNTQYTKWWAKYRWPASKPTGYVAIIRINSIA